MPGLVFYNFAPTPFVEISSGLFTAEAFIAFLKKIDLTYILAAGAALSFLIFGYLSWLPLMPPGRGEQREKAYSLMRL
jgi:hypothetical protein